MRSIIDQQKRFRSFLLINYISHQGGSLHIFASHQGRYLHSLRIKVVTCIHFASRSLLAHRHFVPQYFSNASHPVTLTVATNTQTSEPVRI